MKVLFIVLILFCCTLRTAAQSPLDTLFPVRALSISAPGPALVDSFVTFIQQELAPAKVNTLLLRVDYNFQYKTHPELVGGDALSLADVKKIVAACRKNNIAIIPQINLLGHQSWAEREGRLLQVYPQFDETPHVKMPESYKWPNADGLYCKSYCPLHPEVHGVVFALVDELCDAFEAAAFHAGMDEVFYIGDDKCPRCGGLDKAQLFADEVRRIRDHLMLKKRSLWIWGDRLLDGKTTGLGMWEASLNNTHRAIDMIPQDVVICDWHYDRPDKTAVYFAMKGFRVVTCSWRKPHVAVAQVNDMMQFRKSATRAMKDRFYGMMETVWSGTAGFMREYYSKPAPNTPGNSTAATFTAMFDEMRKF